MDAATEAAIDKARGTRGRKDTEGNESVIKLKVVEDRIADLCVMHDLAAQANERYREAVKATAEAAGLLTVTVSKFVAARAGDKWEEQQTKVQQLALVFEEIGEVKGARQGTLV